MDLLKKNPMKYGLIFVVIIAVIIGGIFLNRWWNTPLGPPLDNFTPTLELNTEETQTPEKETATATINPTATLTEMPGTATMTPTPEPLCGGPEELTLLFTGVDSNNYIFGLADAIRIVKIDFLKGEVTVLPLPRDLWVDIPVSITGLTQDVTMGKLNQAYFYGTPGMGVL